MSRGQASSGTMAQGFFRHRAGLADGSLLLADSGHDDGLRKAFRNLLPLPQLFLNSAAFEQLLRTGGPSRSALVRGHASVRAYFLLSGGLAPAGKITAGFFSKSWPASQHAPMFAVTSPSDDTTPGQRSDGDITNMILVFYHVEPTSEEKKACISAMRVATNAEIFPPSVSTLIVQRTDTVNPNPRPINLEKSRPIPRTPPLPTWTHRSVPFAGFGAYNTRRDVRRFLWRTC